MAVQGQAMLAQDAQSLIALGRANLDHHAQFLVEQGLQTALMAPHPHLGRPVFAVTVVGTAVADAVAFGDQHIDVQGHAHLAGKSHFCHGRQQTTIAAVVVGQHQ